MKGTVNPEELLNTLSAYLGTQGNIKGETEAEKLVNCMKQSSLLVSQCTFMNIVRATTENAVLFKFLDAGGWNILYKWLIEFKNANDSALLYELLRVYQVLPVNTDLLKANKTAKIIKLLTKSADEKVKTLAEATVNRWMQVVRENSKGASKESSKANKKEKTDVEMDSDESSARTKEEMQDQTSDTDVNNGIADNISSISIGSLETKDRPRTVKLVNSKFRSTGLEEAVNKPVSKKNMLGSNNKASSPVAGIKRPIPANNESSLILEKKVKPTLPAVETETGKIKMIPPKPKTVFESTGFMDALMLPTVAAVRKKRKPSVQALSKNESSPPAAPVSPTISAPPSFYKDTLESPTIGTSTTFEDKLAWDTNSGSPTGRPAVQSPNRVDATGVADVDMSAASSGPNNVGKKKKQVSWAEDSALRKIFLFELDETERINVNRLKVDGELSSFDEMKKKEMLLDREVFKQSHSIGHSGARESVIEKMEWFSPPLIDNLPPLRVEAGVRSRERGVQQEREGLILQAIFFHNEKIPISATEPDHEAPDVTKKPTVIPLETAVSMPSGDMYTDISSLDSVNGLELARLPDSIMERINLLAAAASDGQLPVGAADPHALLAALATASDMGLHVLVDSDTDSGNPREHINALLGGSLQQQQHLAAAASMLPTSLPPPPRMTPPPHVTRPPPHYHHYDMDDEDVDGPNMPPPNSLLGRAPLLAHPGMVPHYMPRMSGGPPPRGPPPQGMRRGMGHMRMQGGGPPPPHHQQQQQMGRTPCRHYLMRGTCKFGMNCQFLHSDN